MAAQHELTSELRQKNQMLDAIKQTCEEQGALARDWYGQTIDWRNRYQEIKQYYDKEMLNLNAHLQLQ
eukprot:11606421-Prorocentrum_lima.AAC.1